MKRGDTLMKNRFRLTQSLGLRTARTLDVRARAAMMAIEKQNARPQIDGLFVLVGEVLIKTRK